MAALIQNALNYSHRLAAPPAGGAGAALRRLAVAVADHRQRQRELQQLLAMDDRALADIGLTRSDALWVANDRGRRELSPPAAPPVITGAVIEDRVRHAHALRGRVMALAARRFARSVRHGLAGAARALRGLS